ncbi:MAG: YihY/virulence factor BrkB family protein [Burkholderiales bacterium]|jgi:membrane protein|nr:YihY/virulence factor BrkB family protein [Burkholderiales bacterium]
MKLTRIGISKPTQHLLAHPLAFALQTLRGFNKNQGMMLAGAIAYYALLSMVPLLILSIIALTHLVDKADLLIALGRYLEWLVPSQSQAVLGDLNDFLDNGIAIGAVLLLTMLFFSSLAFGILEKAIALIFPHRGTVDKRHALVSAVLPYCFVLMLGVALLCMTLASIVLQAMAHESLHFLGRDWSLVGLSGLFFYVLGFTAEVLIVATLYWVLPVGRIQWRHAVIGGFFVAGAWEVIRHALVWYFTTLSKASVVYGSFTTAVVALFCMEIIAALLLLGAQVMSEYERLEQF